MKNTGLLIGLIVFGATWHYRNDAPLGIVLGLATFFGFLILPHFIRRKT